MKKLIQVLVIAALLAGVLTSCGGTTELTAENYSRYLSFETEVGEVKESSFMGYTFYESTLTIRVSPRKPGSFSNTALTVSFDLPSFWRLGATDPAYDETAPDQITLDIELPANGQYTRTVVLTSIGELPSTSSDYCDRTIISISGAFVQ